MYSTLYYYFISYHTILYDIISYHITFTGMFVYVLFRCFVLVVAYFCLMVTGLIIR